MKILYNIKPDSIQPSNLTIGTYIKCAKSLIIPAGHLQGCLRFIEGHKYRVTKVHISKTPYESFFQIKDEFGKRARIKFKRNKYFTL